MTNIDELLQQLPVEKTGVDFTAKLMDRIAELPAVERKAASRFASSIDIAHVRHLSVRAIIAICAGSLAVLAGGWWAADYFFDWNTLYVQPFFHNAGQALSSIFNPIFHADYSPTVISGMLAGAALLLADAAVRRRMAKRQAQ